MGRIPSLDSYFLEVSIKEAAQMWPCCGPCLNSEPYLHSTKTFDALISPIDSTLACIFCFLFQLKLSGAINMHHQL